MSELKRKTPLRKKAFAEREIKPETKQPRKKTCAVCKSKFQPMNSLTKVCSPVCAGEYAQQVRLKKERKEDKERKQKLKGINELKKEAQEAFNRFIRTRDLMAGHGCICCGNFATAAALSKPGGAYDAAHYRSRGSADHLRFDEDNVHLALKDCNMWGHKDYRGGLIQRIGLERVEALECNNVSIKWTKDGLVALKKHYQQKLKELIAKRADP